jgi:hypothetical protein
MPASAVNFPRSQNQSDYSCALPSRGAAQHVVPRAKRKQRGGWARWPTPFVKVGTGIAHGAESLWHSIF